MAQRRCCPLGSKPLSGCALLRGSPLAAFSQGPPWPIDSSSPSCHPSLRRGMRVPAQPLLESSPSLACRGPLVTLPFPVLSDSFPPNSPEICHTGSSCLCGWEKLVQHTSVWNLGEQETLPRQAGTERQALQKELCVLVLPLLCLS